METIVMGKKVKNVYSVVTNKDDNGKYTDKPYMHKEIEKTYEEICRYEGTPQSVDRIFSNEIYLSEDELVVVDFERFRADLGVWHQCVDKVLEEKDVNLKKAEKELAAELKLYNTQMIENNAKAKAYCDVHKLDYAETDYEELMEIIKPESDGYTVTATIPNYTSVDWYSNWTPHVSIPRVVL